MDRIETKKMIEQFSAHLNNVNNQRIIFSGSFGSGKTTFLKEFFENSEMLVKVYGFSMAGAMKQAWQVLKLKAALKNGVVKFYYQKLNGEVRTAWGTLKEALIPETKGTERKKNESLITYYDNEKQAFRSFKIANLIKVG